MVLRMTNNSTIADNTPSRGDVQRRLRRELPSSWLLEMAEAETERGPDAVLDLRAPDGRSASILVEIKRRLDPIAVPRVLEQMQSWAWRAATGTPVSYLVAAPFLSERTRERLRESGLNYIDCSGNALVAIEEPAVYIRTQGADKDPNPSSRPKRSLRGEKTAKIVRTLVDFRAPLGVRQIAEIAGTDPGNVSRVLDLLEREDLVRRSPQGGVQSVDWSGLLGAWSRDYSVTRSNKYATYLDPRGLGNFLVRLRSLPTGIRYAVTGSLAASRLAPVAPARLGAAFVDDIVAASEALGLVPTETGANVMLLEPRGDFVYERLRIDEGVRYAAPSQVVADLFEGSGRSPAEAEALLEWMRRNEDEWRS